MSETLDENLHENRIAEVGDDQLGLMNEQVRIVQLVKRTPNERVQNLVTVSIYATKLCGPNENNMFGSIRVPENLQSRDRFVGRWRCPNIGREIRRSTTEKVGTTWIVNKVAFSIWKDIDRLLTEFRQVELPVVGETTT